MSKKKEHNIIWLYMMLMLGLASSEVECWLQWGPEFESSKRMPRVFLRAIIWHKARQRFYENVTGIDKGPSTGSAL